MEPQGRVVLFSDLDGTLLDAQTYSWNEAREALELMRLRGIPLVLCTSKTRAEVEGIRRALENRDPFIVENGGAIYIPQIHWQGEIPGAVLLGDYWRIGLGVPYDVLVPALAKIAKQTGTKVRGFSEMDPGEIAQLTDLSLEEAQDAKEREYDEPFVLAGAGRENVVAETAESLGLQITRGGRLWHLHGGSDKGKAVERVRSLYRQKWGSITTVGLGDSANDLPLLAAVDVPILVQKPNGSYDVRVNIARLIRAPAPGPKGWNWSVKWLLDQPCSGTTRAVSDV